MKNIISKSDANETKEFVNQRRNVFENAQNQLEISEQKQYKKSATKLIKGKVKVYSNNSFPRLTNYENLDDETELFLISERMLHFLKFTFLFIILITLLLLLK
jgi:hypothetical protein